MHNFPRPYPDELLYSTVARAGVHLGITSPKQLLDEVFGDRRVVATSDLSSSLGKVARQYPDQTVTVEKLAYAHTLFPLYAPFIPEERRKRCLRLMDGKARGASHLALGVAASRIRQARNLSVCPECIAEQLGRYGEPYWARRWQIRGAECCPGHGLLVETRVKRHGDHRHAFQALSPGLIPITVQEPCVPEQECVARRITELLNLPPMPAPRFGQWTRFYLSLARGQGYTRGKVVDHDALWERVLSVWSGSWLDTLGLRPTEDSPEWLKALFRRHRKAASYLEHLIVLQALLDPGWTFGDVFRRVSHLSDYRPKAQCVTTSFETGQELNQKRREWKACVILDGAKRCRDNGHNALYATLYRNDREWLLRINRLHPAPARKRKTRIDWGVRDRTLFAELCTLWLSRTEGPSPRHSQEWYLTQLGGVSTIRGSLDKLPCTANFLAAYSESIEQYQARRIRLAMHTLSESDLPLKRWRILRAAGLSEQRLKPLARTILAQVK
jgi:hypothetical protein